MQKIGLIVAPGKISFRKEASFAVAHFPKLKNLLRGLAKVQDKDNVYIPESKTKELKMMHIAIAEYNRYVVELFYDNRVLLRAKDGDDAEDMLVKVLLAEETYRQAIRASTKEAIEHITQTDDMEVGFMVLFSILAPDQNKQHIVDYAHRFADALSASSKSTNVQWLCEQLRDNLFVCAQPWIRQMITLTPWLAEKIEPILVEFWSHEKDESEDKIVETLSSRIPGEVNVTDSDIRFASRIASACYEGADMPLDALIEMEAFFDKHTGIDLFSFLDILAKNEALKSYEPMGLRAGRVVRAELRRAREKLELFEAALVEQERDLGIIRSASYIAFLVQYQELRKGQDNVKLAQLVNQHLPIQWSQFKDTLKHSLDGLMDAKEEVDRLTVELDAIIHRKGFARGVTLIPIILLFAFFGAKLLLWFYEGFTREEVPCEQPEPQTITEPEPVPENADQFYNLAANARRWIQSTKFYQKFFVPLVTKTLPEWTVRKLQNYGIMGFDYDRLRSLNEWRRAVTNDYESFIIMTLISGHTVRCGIQFCYLFFILYNTLTHVVVDTFYENEITDSAAIEWRSLPSRVRSEMTALIQDVLQFQIVMGSYRSNIMVPVLSTISSIIGAPGLTQPVQNLLYRPPRPMPENLRAHFGMEPETQPQLLERAERGRTETSEDTETVQLVLKKKEEVD